MMPTLIGIAGVIIVIPTAYLLVMHISKKYSDELDQAIVLLTGKYVDSLNILIVGVNEELENSDTSLEEILSLESQLPEIKELSQIIGKRDDIRGYYCVMQSSNLSGRYTWIILAVIVTLGIINDYYPFPTGIIWIWRVVVVIVVLLAILFMVRLFISEKKFSSIIQEVLHENEI